MVDTKWLISGRDSLPTRIPMICHWMLSAPTSCYTQSDPPCSLPASGTSAVRSERRLPGYQEVSLTTPGSHTHTHIHTAKAHGPSEVLRSNVVILRKNSRHKSLSGRVCFPGKPLAAKHSRVLHSCFMVSGITEFTNTLQASYYPLLASIFIFQP